MGNIMMKIIEILRIVLEDDDINIYNADEDLLLYGMDSRLFIRMLILLEEEFQIKVYDSYLFYDEMNTINKIFHVIELIKQDNLGEVLK